MAMITVPCRFSVRSRRFPNPRLKGIAHNASTDGTHVANIVRHLKTLEIRSSSGRQNAEPGTKGSCIGGSGDCTGLTGSCIARMVPKGKKRSGTRGRVLWRSALALLHGSGATC